MTRSIRTWALVGALPCVVHMYGCTKAETSLVGPTGSKCQVTATGAPLSFDASGGSGTMNIAAARDCPWTISVEPAWISINGNRVGQGEAHVPYTVGVNPAPSTRNGAIAVEGALVRLTQAAAPCRFELNKSQDSVGRTGGRVTVSLAALAGCRWTATSNAAWLVIASGNSGTENATIALDVAPNNGPARVGVVTIAGLAFTVNQSGTAGGPQPPPTQPPPTQPPPTQPPTPTPPTPQPPGGNPGAPTPTDLVLVGVNDRATGSCPDVTFALSDHTVTTNRQTDYDRMSCRDLVRRERSIRVTGRVGAAGVVEASSIERIRGDDNDD